jgi:hypothetical protein
VGLWRRLWGVNKGFKSEYGDETKFLTIFIPPKSPISPSTQNDKSNATNLDYKEKPY